MSLKIKGALSDYKLQEMADIDCGKFTIRIKQAAVHNEKFRAAVTSRALKAKRKSLVPSKGAITGSYEEDVRLFCDEVIAGWGDKDGKPHPMLDDDGQVIEPTRENFYEIFTSSSNGKVLFGKLMTAAMDDDTFVLSETDMGNSSKS